MADQSAIEWTDTTWNPVTGCDRVSPGCAHCYALDLAARLKRMGQPKYQRDGDPKTSGPGFGVTLHERELAKPPRWKKPRRVFVNSMSDLFHEEVPDEFIAKAFTVMRSADRHVFQVLTKRPERMHDLLRRLAWRSPSTEEGWEGVRGWQAFFAPTEDVAAGSHICPNVWLGVSIENRRFVHRADLLRRTPAAVRFISAEPLLGPLIGQAGREARRAMRGDQEALAQLNRAEAEGRSVGLATAARASWPRGPASVWSDGYDGPELDLTDIDWLIAGGESGPGHRRIDPQWVRDLRDATRSCDPEPAFFFKQWGGPKPTSGGRELDGRTWDEFPTPTQPKETALTGSDEQRSQL